jgi:hypothetical protein
MTCLALIAPRGVTTWNGYVALDVVVMDVTGVLVSIEKEVGYFSSKDEKQEVTKRYGQRAPPI